MMFRASVLGFAAAALISPSPPSQAAEADAVKRMVELNQTAIASFKAKGHDKAKDQLMEAVVLGKENGLGTHAMMARTYFHLGVVHTEGLKDPEKAGRFFGMALRIRPDLTATGPLATKAVTKAFAEAHARAQAGPGGEASPAVAAPAKEAGEAPTKEPPAPPATKEPPVPPVAEPASDAKKAAAQAKADEVEERQRDKKLWAENEKLLKNLAEVQGRERKEREAREKLEEQLKGRGDKEQQLAKQVDEAQARERSERASKEKLDAALKDTKTRLQQLEQQLAEAQARERNESEGRQKLEKERQVAEAQARDQRAADEKALRAREALAVGPDLPSDLRETLYCPQLDELSAGADFYVHCAVQSHIKAKELVFFYRTAGGVQYNAIVLARTRKGWMTGLLPASRLTGKLLQYYVEARSASGGLVVNSGKAGSPNVAMLLPATGPGPAVAESKANDAVMASMTGTKRSGPVQARAPRARRPQARPK